MSKPAVEVDRKTRSVLEWTSSEVCQFIRGLGDEFYEFGVAFTKWGINGSVLIELNDKDLERLGIKDPLHVKVLKLRIAQLKPVPARPVPFVYPYNEDMNAGEK